MIQKLNTDNGLQGRWTEGLLLTAVWRNGGFSAPQTHLWLIKHWFSASTFVVKIATFAKPETVTNKAKKDSDNDYDRQNGLRMKNEKTLKEKRFSFFADPQKRILENHIKFGTLPFARPTNQCFAKVKEPNLAVPLLQIENKFKIVQFINGYKNYVKTPIIDFLKYLLLQKKISNISQLMTFLTINNFNDQ